jgi:hypothetical protein
MHARDCHSFHASPTLARLPIDVEAAVKVVVVPGASRLDAEASLAPVSPLRIISTPIALVLCALFPLHPFATRGDAVPDGITGPQSDPLRDRAVLLLRFRELLLRTERLVGLRKECQYCSCIREGVISSVQAS